MLCPLGFATYLYNMLGDVLMRRSRLRWLERLLAGQRHSVIAHTIFRKVYPCFIRDIEQVS